MPFTARTRLSSQAVVLAAALLSTACGHGSPAALSHKAVKPAATAAAKPTVSSAVAPSATLIKSPAAAAAPVAPVAPPAAAPAATANVQLAINAPTAASAPIAIQHAAAPPTTASDDDVPTEMIVHFKNGQRPLAGAELKGALKMDNTYVYQLKTNAFSLMADDDWTEADDIDYVEPNYKYHVAAVPNDPQYAGSWGVGAINAPNVWGVSQGEDVIVGVVDTGIAYDHPDLAGQVVQGVDLVNPGGTAYDDHGHGTHCAGTIAALSNNGIAVAGVAPHAKVMPIKVLDASGTGTNETIANGILAAAQRGCKVINLSLGGSEDSQTLRQAIATVNAQGVTVVCAGGNDGNDKAFYPAACDGVIGVGAVDQRNQRASFSNYGTTDVSLAAPGVDIASTSNTGGVATMSGTSMAAPHVAGAAALMLSVFPQLKPLNILTAMVRGGHATTGFSGGQVMALDAEAAMAAVGTLDLTAPSVPTGLNGVAGAPGSVQLSWAPAQDNVRVLGYRVWRNGQVLTTTADTSFVDLTGGSATYAVSAFDADGNESAASTSITANAGAASNQILNLVAADRGTDHLTLTWQTAQPMRCCLSWGATAQLGTNSNWETTAGTYHMIELDGLQRFRSYNFRVAAADDANQVQYSAIAHARTRLFWFF